MKDLSDRLGLQNPARTAPADIPSQTAQALSEVDIQFSTQINSDGGLDSTATKPHFTGIADKSTFNQYRTAGGKMKEKARDI